MLIFLIRLALLSQNREVIIPFHVDLHPEAVALRPSIGPLIEAWHTAVPTLPSPICPHLIVKEEIIQYIVAKICWCDINQYVSKRWDMTSKFIPIEVERVCILRNIKFSVFSGYYDWNIIIKLNAVSLHWFALLLTSTVLALYNEPKLSLWTPPFLRYRVYEDTYEPKSIV